MIKRLFKLENGDLAATAIGLTIFLVVVGYVLAPVGLTAMQGVNTTSAGIVSNATGTPTNTTAGNIWFAIVPISLAALIIAVIYMFKNQA